MANELVNPPPGSGSRDQLMNIQCPQLTSKNYNVWAIKMESILDAQGVWEAIDRPTGANVDVKLMKRARAYLLQALPEEIVMQVAKHRDASEMWNALKIRYLGADRVQQARYQTLLHDLEMLRMKESESIDDVAARLGEIATKIRSLGEDVSDLTLVKKLLNVVPESFLQIVAAMEQFLDLQTLSFEDAIGRLKTYEERIRPRNEVKAPSGQALLVRGDWQDRYQNENRQSNRGRGRSRGRGRGRSNSRSRPSDGTRRAEKEDKDQSTKRDKKSVRCYNCDKYGHYAGECRAPQTRGPGDQSC